MTSMTKIIFGIALCLMVILAAVLTRVQGMQHLGVPGVKVVERSVYRDDGAIVGTNAVALPETVLNFTSKELPVAKVVNDWLPKDTVYGQRVYEAEDGFWLQATVVLMGADRTSIHKPEYCLTGQGFQTTKTERDTIDIQQPHPYPLSVVKMTVHREAVTPDGKRVPQSALYVYWFVADQQLTADHNERMLWSARDQIIRGTLQRWAYVSCFSLCQPGQEEATYSRIKEWIAASVPQFQITTGAPKTLAQNP